MKIGGYLLFYKNVEGNRQFLISKSYLGLKDESGKEYVIYLRSDKPHDSPLKTDKRIHDEVRKIYGEILEKRRSKGIRSNFYPRKLESTIIFVDESRTFVNLIGGTIKDQDKLDEIICEELQEELFLNVSSIEEKKMFIKDICGKKEDRTLVRGNDIIRNIFLVNFDTLNDITKEYIENCIRNPALLHQKITLYGFDNFENGEICNLEWISTEKLLEYGKRDKPLNKFEVNDIVRRKFLATSPGTVRSVDPKLSETTPSPSKPKYTPPHLREHKEKYFKYKNKYLELKKTLGM
jgi:hypothetical protein